MSLILRITLVLLVVLLDPYKEVIASFNKNFKKSYYFEKCKIINQKEDTSLHVIEVVDGDTIVVSKDCKPVTVRMIGINTPETVDPRKPPECFGKEASNRAKELLTDAEVKIETDPSQDTHDKYGRLLGYVIMKNGINFNKEMLIEAYAYEYTFKTPYIYQKEFKEAEKDAQNKSLGLWSPTTCNGKK